LALPDRQVPDDLRHLQRVSGLELLVVVLEAPAPVGSHDGLVLFEDVEDLLDLPLADDLADADVLAALDGDHQGEITVLRSDHEVFPAFSQEVSFSKVLDDCSAMFWMDYRVTLTEHTTTSPAGTRGRI